MRVLLAEGQAKVRWALHFFLKEQPGLDLVAEISEAETLLPQIKRTRPDVVLLDWDLLGCAPAEGLAALRRASHTLWVITLGRHPDIQGAALAAGADGFVCKGDPPHVLLAALQAVKSTGNNKGLAATTAA